jgi:hypothetical protein
MRPATKVWGLVGSVTCLTVVGIALALRTSDLEEDLLRDAHQAYGARHRPTHVATPVPGTFGEALRPALEQLEASRAKYQALSDEEKSAWVAVRQGTKPFAELPTACRVELAELRPALEMARRASRRESPTPLPEMDALNAAFWASNATALATLQHAARLLALDLRRQLDDSTSPKDWDRLLDDCVDGLGLGRDLSYSGGLVGLMHATAITSILVDSCGAVVDGAPLASKRDVAMRVIEVRDAWNAFSAVLVDESVFSGIAWAKAALSPKQLQELPPDAFALASSHPTRIDGWKRWLAPWGWRTARREHRQLEDALEAPSAMRANALQYVHDEARASWNPFLRDSDLDLRPLYVRSERALGSLTVIAAAARAGAFRDENKRWPSTAELAAQVTHFSESGALLRTMGDHLELALPDVGIFPAVILHVTPQQVRRQTSSAQ